jgi:hypothetical protein
VCRIEYFCYPARYRICWIYVDEKYPARFRVLFKAIIQASFKVR